MSDDDFLSLIESTLSEIPASKVSDVAENDALADLPVAEVIQLDPPVAPAAEAVAESAAQPVPKTAAVSGTTLLYVGLDAQTNTNITSNFADHFSIYGTVDLPEIKQMVDSGDVALLLFDPTTFIKPGIAITKYIKEKSLPVKVVHVISENRITEEYAKYRQYHLHLQPDFADTTDEIFGLINKIKADLGL